MPARDRTIRRLAVACLFLSLFLIGEGELTGRMCIPAYYSAMTCLPWDWQLYFEFELPIIVAIFFAYPVYVWVWRLRGISDVQIEAELREAERLSPQQVDRQKKILVKVAGVIIIGVLLGVAVLVAVILASAGLRS